MASDMVCVEGVHDQIRSFSTVHSNKGQQITVHHYTVQLALEISAGGNREYAVNAYQISKLHSAIL
jgi:hypothetical protein